MGRHGECEPGQSGQAGQGGQNGQGPKRTTWLWKDANNMDAKEYEINSCMKGNFGNRNRFRNHKLPRKYRGIELE